MEGVNPQTNLVGSGRKWKVGGERDFLVEIVVKEKSNGGVERRSANLVSTDCINSLRVEFVAISWLSK